jgi:hypothetical protein
MRYVSRDVVSIREPFKAGTRSVRGFAARRGASLLEIALYALRRIRRSHLRYAITCMITGEHVISQGPNARAVERRTGSGLGPLPTQKGSESGAIRSPPHDGEMRGGSATPWRSVASACAGDTHAR